MESNGASPTTGAQSVTRWRPGVRLVLALVALIPLLGIGLLTGMSAASSWSNRQDAKAAARDANQLKVIAQARLQVTNAAVPVVLVAGGAAVGLDATTVSKLLGINLLSGPISLPHSAQLIRSDRVLSSTPTLRADSATYQKLISDLAVSTVNWQEAYSLSDSFSIDVDNLWLNEFRHLQSDVHSWNAPGQIETHLSALRELYGSYDAVIFADRDSINVQEGLGGLTDKIDLIQRTGQYSAAAAQFVHELGPLGRKAWDAMNSDPHHIRFEKTVMAPALTLAEQGGTPPYLTDQLAAGIGARLAVNDVTDIAVVVESAAADLRNEATVQAADARNQFTFDVVFLAALIVISVGGVVLASRILTRPLGKLQDAARRIHDGDFDLETLPDTGPREVAATTGAFNVMATTLKAVERKTVALAEEDLNHADMQVTLPGRTGQALQAAVDKLVSRIRERELQRRQLHEAATHDRLTGLLNRAATFEHLTTDVERRRKHGEKVAVLFADLNGLKPLNDNYGHEAGDAAIRFTAEALHEALDDCDVVGRLGGDEFLIVLCSKHSVDPAEASKRIHDALGRRSIPVRGGQFVPLEASVGTAFTECDGDTDPMALVRQADEAMYEAKRAARATRDHLAAAATAAHLATSASEAAATAAQTGSELALAALAAAEAAAAAASAISNPQKAEAS